jgi:hypothetical protein
MRRIHATTFYNRSESKLKWQRKLSEHARAQLEES